MKKSLNLALSLLLLVPLTVITGCIVQIDLVDFIKLNNITYIHDFLSRYSSLNETDLSPYAEIKFRVSENVHNPNYHSKSGDAAFLDRGTIVYSLKGYSPSALVIVKRDGEFLIFEADTNTNAKKGSDLLDIGGKVDFISINSPMDGKTVLASIKDPEQIDNLVRMILETPVDQQSQSTGSEKYFLDFHLKDGITTIKGFSLDTGIMTRGIKLPQEFVASIRSALKKN